MGFKEYLDQLAKDTDRNIALGMSEWKKVDEELGRTKGVFPAIYRAVVKAMEFTFTIVMKTGNALFPGMLPQVQSITSGKVLEITPEVWNVTVDKIGAAVGIDEDGKKMLRSFYATFEGASPIVQGLSLVLMLSNIMAYVMGPGMGKVTQAMSAKMRPNAPGPGDVLGARALDPAIDARIWDVLRRNGIKDSDIELLFMSTYQRIPEQVLREIYYRHDKGVEWAQHRLTELGYTPERIAEVMSIWPAIPQMADMLLFMAHEAYEPDKIRRFGLDAETPGQLLEHAKKLGLPVEDAVRYWISHWMHPGLQNVLDMYHRDIIKWEDVYEYMSVVELPPYWREKIRDSAYNVITRVDARRMYGTGTLNQTDLFNTYRHMGYSPEDSLRLVDFTIKYETGTDKDFTKADIVRAYQYRDISPQEALSYLMRIGYLEDAASFILAQADLDRDRAALKTAVALIKDRFVSNLMTEGEVHGELVRLGLKSEQITLQLQGWRVVVNKNSKLPSKADFDKFLRSGIIGEVEYRAEMGKLGYSKHYTDLYIGYIAKGLEEASGE